MRRLHASAYLALVALLAISCASAPAVDREAGEGRDLYVSLHTTLSIANDLAEEATQAADQLAASGAITPEQARAFGKVAVATRSALRIAGTAYASYARGASGPETFLAAAATALTEFKGLLAMRKAMEGGS